MNSKVNQRTLYLVRHAKASRKYDHIEDFDRPLTGKGYEETYQIADELLREGHVPDVIISSSAIRALSTALIFRRILKVDSDVFFITDRLYEISTRDLFKVIEGLDDRYFSAMLFGHNPSFSFLASEFDASISHIPTAGAAAFRFDCESWKECSSVNAETALFTYP